MRKCLRCGTEMLEGWNVKEDGHKHEIFIDNGEASCAATDGGEF